MESRLSAALCDLTTDSLEKGLETNWVLFGNAELLPMVFGQYRVEHKSHAASLYSFEFKQSHILFVYCNEWYIINLLINKQDVTMQCIKQLFYNILNVKRKSHKKTKTINKLILLTSIVCVVKAWYSLVPYSSIVVQQPFIIH